MKSKLNFLVQTSFNRKVKTKWFLIVNIVLFIVVAGVINIDNIINFFGGDFNEKTKIYVIDNVDAYKSLDEQINAYTLSLTGSDESNYELKQYKESVEEAKKMLKEDEKEYDSLVLVFDPSEKEVIDVTLISNESLGLIEYPVLTNAINTTKINLAIKKYNVDNEVLTALSKNVEIKREVLDQEATSTDENMETIITTVFPIFILPFFMLCIFLVQMIGAEVNDEKTTKGMEIIISNVSPKTHFFSKVIAGNLFVLLQGIALIIYVIIGLSIRNMLGSSSLTNSLGVEVSSIFSTIINSELGAKLIYIIPLIIVLMLLSFVAYSLVAGILASMTTNNEDFQQIQTPIMLVSILGYYLAIMAGVFKGAIFIKILAYVPFLSAIISPSLLVMGQFGIIDVLIAILIMIGTIVLLVKYGLKIYKVGILNYSSQGLWKKMFKAIKEK